MENVCKFSIFSYPNFRKHFLFFCLLLLGTLGTSQDQISTFTCQFSNSDGASVIRCGSIITAAVNYPGNTNQVEQISLTFPNSFVINTVTGGGY